jgi:hypothetical protein
MEMKNTFDYQASNIKLKALLDRFNEVVWNCMPEETSRNPDVEFGSSWMDLNADDYDQIASFEFRDELFPFVLRMNSLELAMAEAIQRIEGFILELQQKRVNVWYVVTPFGVQTRFIACFSYDEIMKWRNEEHNYVAYLTEEDAIQTRGVE